VEIIYSNGCPLPTRQALFIINKYINLISHIPREHGPFGSSLDLALSNIYINEKQDRRGRAPTGGHKVNCRCDGNCGLSFIALCAVGNMGNIIINPI